MTSLTNSALQSPYFFTKDNVSLFYTTFLSPNDFLLQYNNDAVVTIKSHNACISLSLEDHINYVKIQQVQKHKNHWYTYSIELGNSKEVTSIIHKIQAATKTAFFSYSQLLSSPITLQQMYFIDSSNSTFHTGLLQSLHARNIESDAVKQFPLNGQLKRKIKEFTSWDVTNSEKMGVDLQKEVLHQQDCLEESRNRVFGKTSREKEKTEAPSFWLLEASSREQVQLSVLNWFEHFLETYKENPKHSIKMLLDNRKILLSQICSHIEDGMYREYYYSQYSPSTLASLDLLFAILQKLYVENSIPKEDLLEFLLPIEKEATPTCFVLEQYYYLSVGHSYVYLLGQILKERSLHSEVFLRMKKCVYCKHSRNASTFLLRLRRGIKSAKLDWKFRDDTRGVSNLYPLLQALDACRRKDSISLQQRIAMIFSCDKIPLNKVLQAFYRLENRMNRKDWFPSESEEQIVSLQELEERLQFHKEIYPKELQECQNRNKEAEERRIRQKEKEIADLQKLIDEVESWKPDDGFNPSSLFTVGFCTLFRGEDIESIKRKAYSARQDALREWENWEWNGRASRSHEGYNSLGLFGLMLPFSSVSMPQKEKEPAISATYENPTPSGSTSLSLYENRTPRGTTDLSLEDLMLTLRLENLRNDTTPPSLEELTERHRNLFSCADLEERLQRLRL